MGWCFHTPSPIQAKGYAHKCRVPGVEIILTGTVLFNDAPVADASVTAVDLAAGKAIALTPWSDVPTGLKLLSTQRTDVQGGFDLALGHPWPSQDQPLPGQVFELPKLADNQIVKLVATKGGQTFTALFNSRGQDIGADTPTTASYQLQQGAAVSVTIRLRLTAGRISGKAHGIMFLVKIVRKHKLGEPEPNDWVGTTPEERVLAVWPLTRTAYAFQGEDPGDARLHRHVVRVIRRPG
jgi:hypothetical protein